MKSSTKNIKTIIELGIILIFILGIVTSAICDLAISKKFSWSLYPIVSIVYAFLIIAPLFHFKKSAVMLFLSFSVFLIPFLFCLERITAADWLLSFGIPFAGILIAYLWTVYGVFAIKRLRWWYSSAISLIAAIPCNLLVDFVISKVTNEPIFDIWDTLSYGIVIIVSFGLFCAGYFAKRKTVSQ